jgi:hypothetical protein
MLIGRIAILALCIAAVILDSAHSLRSAPQKAQQQSKQSAPTSQTDKRGTEEAPFIVKVLPTPESEQKTAADEKEKANNDALLALFTERLFWATAALALMAFLQLLVFGWQGIQLGRTIDLSKNEFISTHRPKLIVRQFVLTKPEPDQIVKIDFSIINVGSTEATWRYLAAEVALWNGQYWEAPGIDHIIKPISLPPIKNGQRVSATIQSRFNITADQIRAVEKGNLIVCAVGELTYADALATNRRTSFRRNYDCSTDMFITSPNPDQEYQD